MASIYGLFKVGRTGKLIFDRRPWCYYYATVTDPITTDFTNYENGLVTIHMKAMYPFARSDIMTRKRTDKYCDIMMTNTAVFEKEEMENNLELTNFTHQTDFIKNKLPIVIGNPGQEEAALGVAISGDVGTGVIIANATTGQSMKFVAVKKADTSNKSPMRYALVDPISGKTTLTDWAGYNQLAFRIWPQAFRQSETFMHLILNQVQK